MVVSCLAAHCGHHHTLSEGLTIVLSVQVCCAQASDQEEQRQEWLMMRRLRQWRGSGAACSAASPLTGVSGLTLMHPSSTIGSWTRAKTVSGGNQVACYHALWVFDQDPNKRWHICTICPHEMFAFELGRCASYRLTRWYFQLSRHMCFVSTCPTVSSDTASQTTTRMLKLPLTKQVTAGATLSHLDCTYYGYQVQHAAGVMGTLSQGKTWETSVVSTPEMPNYDMQAALQAHEAEEELPLHAA